MCLPCLYCRQMSWNIPLKGWWMGLLTPERLQDLGSAWLWDRWADTRRLSADLWTAFGSNHSFHTHVFSANSYMCLSSSAGLFYVQSITIWTKIYQLLKSDFLWQVLNAFEDVTLQSTLNRIKQKHNLQTVKKVRCFITLIDIYSRILFQRCLGSLAVQ